MNTAETPSPQADREVPCYRRIESSDGRVAVVIRDDTPPQEAVRVLRLVADKLESEPNTIALDIGRMPQ